MTRRFLACLFAATLVTMTVSPSFAASKMVSKQVSKGQGVFFGQGLLPQHLYKVQVKSLKNHQQFTALVLENYTYVLGGHFYSAHKNLQIDGTTPQSFSIKQPVNTTLNGWMMAVQIKLARFGGIDVRVYDEGKQK